MRQLDRTAVVERAQSVPGCWQVSAMPPRPVFGPDPVIEPTIAATFFAGAEDATDGFSAKALAIEYARLKFRHVEVREHVVGLAPMKEQGQKACAVCESTACVTVGGPEPCPGSD